MAQRYQKEIIQEVPEVDAVLGTTSYGDIVKALEEAVAGNHFEEFRDIDYLPDTGSKRVLTTGGHFGYLKIAEGCDKFDITLTEDEVQALKESKGHTNDEE